MSDQYLLKLLPLSLQGISGCQCRVIFAQDYGSYIKYYQFKRILSPKETFGSQDWDMLVEVKLERSNDMPALLGCQRYWLMVKKQGRHARRLGKHSGLVAARLSTSSKRTVWHEGSYARHALSPSIQALDMKERFANMRLF